MKNSTIQQEKKNLIFTRFLYALDEVFLTMLTCILQKKLKESLFWYGEWISSINLDIAKEEIWKIYYDFYAILYPKMENYIQKKIEKCFKQSQSEAILTLSSIIKNFIIRDSDSSVFTIRQYFIKYPTSSKIYRGRRPKWLDKFDKSYHILLLSLHKKDFKNFYYFLKSSNQQIDDIHQNILTYYSTVVNISINTEIANQKWMSNMYNDKKHLLLVIVCYLNRDESSINLRKMFVSTTKEEKILILSPEKTVSHGKETEKYPNAPYKKLFKNRLFAIDPCIGSFYLQRWSEDKPLNELLRNHWEYFAYKNPLWKERFHKYSEKYKKDHNEMILLFIDDENDEKYEAFYEEFGYEPDEQTLEVQEKSVLDIAKLDPSTWIKKHFQQNFDSDKKMVNNKVIKQFVW